MVTEVFEGLKKLQNILVEKYKLEAEVQEAPKQLTTQDEFLARLKKEYIAKNAEYDQIKEKVNTLKLDLDEAVKARESGEKGMDNITTHREYEALEKQINEATEKENEIRKELQNEEKKFSEISENIKIAKESIATQEDELNKKREVLDNQLADCKSKIAALQAEEDQITPGINQEILFKFQRIIQRNSEGIVAVRNGVCNGCHMILPAQFANVVRTGDEINFCPYCSRILYYEEVSEEEQENFFDISSAGDFDEDDYEESDGFDEEEREERDEESFFDDESDVSDDEIDDEMDDDQDDDDSDAE